MKELNRTDHQGSIGEIAIYSEVLIRELSFFHRSLRASEWNDFQRRRENTERDGSIWEGVQRWGAETKPLREAIARPCVKNEDIQMEIWFYINHQARTVLPGHFSVSPCSLSLPFFPFPLSNPRVHLLLVLSSSFFVLIFAIRPTIPGAFLFSCSSLLLREARDRHLYRWQRDSFVLSRRLQLIFIVYLPDRRYLEDNRPPLYIHTCSGIALLLRPIYYLSIRRGWLFSSVSAFDLPETDCVNRHCWMLLISIF